MGPGFGRFGGNSGQAQQAQPAYSSPYGAAYGTSAQPTMIATNPLNQPQMNTQQAALGQAAANQAALQNYSKDVSAVNQDYGNLGHEDWRRLAAANPGTSFPSVMVPGANGQMMTSAENYYRSLLPGYQPPPTPTVSQAATSVEPVGRVDDRHMRGDAYEGRGRHERPGSQSAMANGGLTALLPAFQRAR